MGLKVAVVGAASTYTPELVEGFARRVDRLPVDTAAARSTATAAGPSGIS